MLRFRGICYYPRACLLRQSTHKNKFSPHGEAVHLIQTKGFVLLVTFSKLELLAKAPQTSSLLLEPRTSLRRLCREQLYPTPVQKLKKSCPHTWSTLGCAQLGGHLVFGAASPGLPRKLRKQTFSGFEQKSFVAK